MQTLMEMTFQTKREEDSMMDAASSKMAATIVPEPESNKTTIVKQIEQLRSKNGLHAMIAQENIVYQENMTKLQAKDNRYLGLAQVLKTTKIANLQLIAVKRFLDELQSDLGPLYENESSELEPR